jgi:hypothetical protein
VAVWRCGGSALSTVNAKGSGAAIVHQRCESLGGLPIVVAYEHVHFRPNVELGGAMYGPGQMTSHAGVDRG